MNNEFNVLNTNLSFKSGDTARTASGIGLSPASGDTVIINYTLPKKVPNGLTISCTTTSFWAFAQHGNDWVDVSNRLSIASVKKTSDYTISVIFNLSQTLVNYVVAIGTSLTIQFS